MKKLKFKDRKLQAYEDNINTRLNTLKEKRTEHERKSEELRQQMEAESRNIQTIQEDTRRTTQDLMEVTRLRQRLGQTKQDVQESNTLHEVDNSIKESDYIITESNELIAGMNPLKSQEQIPSLIASRSATCSLVLGVFLL